MHMHTADKAPEVVEVTEQFEKCEKMWGALKTGVHCKNKGGQSPPTCLCQHTNCPFGVLWETKWWALPTFVLTV